MRVLLLSEGGGKQPPFVWPGRRLGSKQPEISDSWKKKKKKSPLAGRPCVSSSAWGIQGDVRAACSSRGRAAVPVTGLAALGGVWGVRICRGEKKRTKFTIYGHVRREPPVAPAGNADGETEVATLAVRLH